MTVFFQAFLKSSFATYAEKSSITIASKNKSQYDRFMIVCVCVCVVCTNMYESLVILVKVMVYLKR